jgi:hypothetical protein
MDTVYRTLEDAKLLEREFSLSSLLRRAQEYARRIIHAEALEGGFEIDPATQMPSGVIGPYCPKGTVSRSKGSWDSVD